MARNRESIWLDLDEDRAKLEKQKGKIEKDHKLAEERLGLRRYRQTETYRQRQARIRQLNGRICEREVAMFGTSL